MELIDEFDGWVSADGRNNVCQLPQTRCNGYGACAVWVIMIHG